MCLLPSHLATPAVSPKVTGVGTPSGLAVARLQEAYQLCQDEVSDQLRAPGTAVWPALADISAQPGENRFYIDGYVDSENGFGALLRLDFSCRIQVDGGRFGAVTASVRDQ